MLLNCSIKLTEISLKNYTNVKTAFMSLIKHKLKEQREELEFRYDTSRPNKFHRNNCPLYSISVDYNLN